MGKQDNEMLSPWQRVESLFRLASLVAISASAVLAAVQFYNGRADARKEQSVALINAWQANDARKAYATLRQEIEDAVETAGPIPANIPDEAQEQIKYNIGTALIQRWGEDEGRDADTMTANIEAVINFYTEIHFCIQANLCDESLLMQYFADEVTSFWDYFEPYAEMRRQGFYPNYGIAVERLVAHIDM